MVSGFPVPSRKRGSRGFLRRFRFNVTASPSVCWYQWFLTFWGWFKLHIFGGSKKGYVEFTFCYLLLYRVISTQNTFVAQNKRSSNIIIPGRQFRIVDRVYHSPNIITAKGRFRIWAHVYHSSLVSLPPHTGCVYDKGIRAKTRGGRVLLEYY